MTVKKTTVAGLLKEARLKSGLSIKEIAADICVRSTYLTAMEEGRFEELPAETFAIGFVKAYATALKLDAEAIVAAFKKETGYAQKATSRPVGAVAAVAAPRRSLPSWLSPVAGLLGVSLCWMAFGPSFGFMETPDANNRIATYQEEKQLDAVKAQLQTRVTEAEEIIVSAGLETEQVQAAHDTTATESVALDVAAQDTAKPLTVERKSLFTKAANASSSKKDAPASSRAVALIAREDSWVRLTGTDGNELWSGVLHAGEQYRPGFAGKLHLSTSNAGGLEVLMPDAEPILLGARGDTVTGYPLVVEPQFGAAQAPAGRAGTR